MIERIKKYNTESGTPFTNDEYRKYEKLVEILPDDMYDVIRAYCEYCERKNRTGEWQMRLDRGWLEGGNWNEDD
ncbi:MAG: hypothetical protein LBL42_08235 [Tannerella sp.]|jgi:hypothetical protein|nr:hypothetical protein [Tannerella sp.]